MRTVQCYECRKRYDYDEDGFCPRCGAFNQPARSTSSMRRTDSRAAAQAGSDRKLMERTWQDLGRDFQKMGKSFGKLLESKPRNRRLPGGDF